MPDGKRINTYSPGTTRKILKRRRNEHEIKNLEPGHHRNAILSARHGGRDFRHTCERRPGGNYGDAGGARIEGEAARGNVAGAGNPAKLSDRRCAADLPGLSDIYSRGALVETTTVFSSAQRSPGHGFWEHMGGKTFKAVSKAFLFNPDGTWAGTQTLTQAIEFGDDPDVFNSNATTEIVAPNGNIILSGCATAVAQRME